MDANRLCKVREILMICAEDHMAFAQSAAQWFLRRRGLLSADMRDDCEGEACLTLVRVVRAFGDRDPKEFRPLLQTAIVRHLSRWATTQMFQTGGVHVPQKQIRLLSQFWAKYGDQFPTYEQAAADHPGLRLGTYRGLMMTQRRVDSGVFFLTQGEAKALDVDHRTGRTVDDPSMWVDAMDEKEFQNYSVESIDSSEVAA